MLVVLADWIKKCQPMRGRRIDHNRHCGIVGVLKTIPMVLTIIGLSLIAAVFVGGGAMIGAFATHIAAHFAVETVGAQSKCSHFFAICKMRPLLALDARYRLRA